jgi:hypothetical protein
LALFVSLSLRYFLCFVVRMRAIRREVGENEDATMDLREERTYHPLNCWSQDLCSAAPEFTNESPLTEKANYQY